jgi:hypothetical protein
MNDAILLMEYSEGKFSYNDIDNLYVEELPYLTVQFKQLYEQKQNNKQEYIKGVMEFVNARVDVLFKLLSGRKI